MLIKVHNLLRNCTWNIILCVFFFCYSKLQFLNHYYVPMHNGLEDVLSKPYLDRNCKLPPTCCAFQSSVSFDIYPTKLLLLLSQVQFTSFSVHLLYCDTTFFYNSYYLAFLFPSFVNRWDTDKALIVERSGVHSIFKGGKLFLW